MADSRLDDLTRTVAKSRRSLLGGGLAVAVGWLELSDAIAKKRRRKNRTSTKSKPNAYGCFSVDVSCKTADQCCSGICEGKKGKKRCVAHDTGMCDQEALGFCEAASPYPTRCNNQPMCFCTRTTAGSSICGTAEAPSVCADCTKDADCAALGLPPGSACVPFSEGNCAGSCESGMACMAPCGSPPPGPQE